MISVVGAGPAGCFYSSKEKHDDITLFEEHKEIGKPFSCSGVLTGSINKILKIPDNLIINRIKQFKINAPDGNSITIPLKNPNLIIDRTKFDQFLASKAEDNGAKIHLGEKFEGFKIEDDVYKLKTNKKIYTTHMIVGSDGPHSQVAKSAKIYKHKKFLTGLQSRVEIKNLDIETTQIFLDKGDFGWIIPEDDKIARVGVLGHPNQKLYKDYKDLLGKSKIIQNISGTVPVYDPEQELRDENNVFLIGDAASQLKATTYGGIIFGLYAGKYLAQNKEMYVENFNKHLKKELVLSLKIRNLMNSMTVSQKNKMVKLFSSKRCTKILSSHDRDYPSKFLFKLVLANPALVPFGFNLLRNLKK